MHILIVTHYFEPDSGAAAVRLSRLARLLTQRGHNVTVLTTMPHYPQGYIKDGYRRKWSVVEEHDGIKILRSWLWATPSARLSRKLLSQMTFMFTAGLQGLSLNRPDVMLIEAQPMFTSLAGMLLARLKRIPYVLNVSDLWPDHLLSVGALTATHPIYRIARRIVNGTYHSAAGIVAMSPVWADKIAEYIGRRDNLHVIYNGVDLQRFRPELDTSAFRQKHNLGDDRLVTFIGTLATQYDVAGMIEVAKRFASRPDVRFVFIGAGTQSEALRDQLKKVPNVKWLNWIDHVEIPLAWAASDVTYWMMRDQMLYRGTIPAKLYEALAVGVPVAAATEGVAAEMIRDSRAGETVPFGDFDGVTDTITRLLDNSELRQRYIRAGRAYAEQHFNPQTVARHYEEVLQKAIRDRN